MADTTEIAWCDSTFNGWIGCTKVSDGCLNCYAATQDKFRRWTPEGWGGPRKRTSVANWRKPVAWNAEGFCECPACHWRGELGECDGVMRSACPKCFATVNNARRRVFCASLADVFDNQVPVQWRADLFALIAATPNLDWLLLTKRPQNIVSMVHKSGAVAGNGTRYLPKHVWIGTTAEDQKRANQNIVHLLRAKAKLGASVAFVSCEPLLEEVQLWKLKTYDFEEDSEGAEVYPLRGLYAVPDCDWPGPKLDWVIAGGESGPGARPAHPDWFRSLRDQCAAAGVPFLFKQHGEWTGAGGQPNRLPHVWMTLHGDAIPYDAGETYHPPWNKPWRHEDPDTLAFLARVGKKAAGRLLDGREHNEFPEVT